MRIWSDGCNTPEWHMAYDREALRHETEAFLRFYTWPWPSCTWGVSVRKEMLLQPDALESLSILHAERPTGGGLLFHGTDLAFTLFLPEGHPALSSVPQENYDLINGLVLEGLRPFLPLRWPSRPAMLVPASSPSHLCQTKATRYDLSWAGKKIGGCAERRTKRGMLHQTSLFVEEPDWQLISQAIQHKEDISLMQETIAFVRADIHDLIQALSSSLGRLL